MTHATRFAAVFAGLLLMATAPLAAYTLTLSPAAPQVAEGAGSVRITATLTGCITPLSRATWDAFTISGPSPSAQPGQDFGDPRPTFFTIGEGAATVVFVVPILQDTAGEANERFDLSLRPRAGASALACGSVTGKPDAPEVHARITIVDDDGGPPPSPLSSLQPVGALERLIVGGQRLDLSVRAVRADGSVAAGTAVLWAVTTGAALVGGPNSTADQGGIATKAVTLATNVSEVRVTASATGVSNVVFVLRTEVVLGGLFDPETDPGPASVAGVLSDLCRSQGSQRFELCAYLGRLSRDDARSAILELVPAEYNAAGELALEGARQATREIWRRQGELHRSARRQPTTAKTAWQLPTQFPGTTRGTREIERGWGGRNLDGLLARALTGSSLAMAQETDPAATDPGATESRWGLFVSGRASTGDRDATAREPALDYEAQGVAIGVDVRASARLFLGIAADYQEPSGNFGVDGGEVSIESANLTAYLSAVHGGFYFDLLAGAGRDDYSLTRRLALPLFGGGTLNAEGHGEPSGDQRTAGVAIGYDHAAGASTLSLFARGNWAQATIDGFLESSSTSATRLEILEQEVESLLGEAGLEWTYAASFGWGVLQPQLSASALREFEEDAHLLRGRFVEDPDGRVFTVPTDVPDASYFAASGGLTAIWPGGRSLFVLIEHQFDRDNLQVTTAAAGLRFEF